MAIRINEVSPTATVPYLFLPNTNVVSTVDKTEVNLTQI